MLVSGICQKILVERLDKYPSPMRDWTNFPSRQARDICLVSQSVFFGKYHLQAWYISIIPPNIFPSIRQAQVFTVLQLMKFTI